jgi:hypothetical protein
VPYTPLISRLLTIAGSDPSMLVCKWGHDHATVRVKARRYPKRSPGDTPGMNFHCESHSVERRADDWHWYANASAAAENGSALPCGVCFPRFHEALTKALLSQDPSADV